MKKLLIFCIICLIVFMTSSCTKGTVLNNNKNNTDGNSQVITLDEDNKVIYLDFSLADTDLLDKCAGKDISTAEALYIIDQKTYDGFPEKVKSQLQTIKWTWNHKGTVTAVVGIISYE